MGMWVWPSESRRDDVSGQRSYSKSYSLFPDLLLFTSVVHFHLGPITGTCKMANHSIVEYFGDSGGHRCGYCNSSDTNFSHGKPSSIPVATPLLVNSLLANCKTGLLPELFIGERKSIHPGFSRQSKERKVYSTCSTLWV